MIARQTQMLREFSWVTPVEDRAFVAASINAMYGHLQHLLLRADRMGMGESVECRVPYLDNALLDFAMHIPAASKVRDHTPKWLLKEVAVSRLPANIIHAHKWGFSTGRLDPKLGSVLRSGLTPDLLRWSRRRQEEILSLVCNSRALLFIHLNIELWARLFISREPAESLGDLMVAAYRKSGSKPSS